MVDRALATTGGVDSRTGVAGLTLGGGWGWLARKHGMAVDNLHAVDLVTADGELVHASDDENRELFWAVRGGGGNFGVVTSFEFDLHPVGPEVVTAQIFYPLDDGRTALRATREFAAGAPDEVTCAAMVVPVPPEPPFPEAYHGQPAIAIVACYSGEIEEGRSVLAPLGDAGDPILSVIDSMPYTALQRSFDEGAPDGQRYYFKSQYLAALPDDAIDTVLEFVRDLPGAFTTIGLESLGGAVNRVDVTATAFPHRDAAFNFGVWTGWSDPEDDDAMTAWTREFHEAMAPYSTGGAYANYLDADEDDRVRSAYGANYERLHELKAEWDPDNRFRLNTNLEPTTRAGRP